LLDFDLSTFLSPSEELKYGVATKGYKPPESFLKQKKYDYRFDVYSVGCLMLGMLFHKSPFYKFEDKDEQYTANMLHRGYFALWNIDYNNKIREEDYDKYKDMEPFNLWEVF
jgi:casein kinase II subunit alpha